MGAFTLLRPAGEQSRPARHLPAIVLAGLSVLFSVMPGVAVAQSEGAQPASTRRPASMDAFVDDLIGRMTLEEKAAQLCVMGSDHHHLEALARQGLGGSNGVVGKQGPHLRDYLHHMQSLAMQSRLKIPMWFMGDVAHGFRTIFPVPLAEAASWDTALVTQVHHAAADEATSAGVMWTFSPMVDIARDPRWGRVVEGAGEDPYLGAAMAMAQMKGFQGDDLGAADTMLATGKHFAGYGGVEAGRDYNSVYIPAREFRDVYLPPFHALVTGGIGSIMAAFTALDGIPATSSRKLLTGILRDEWGFDGVLVSDFDAVPELVTHGVAATRDDAVVMALHAGVDVDLHSGSYLSALPGLVRSGKVKVSEVDNAVRHVLEAKYKLGLFEDPYRYGDAAREKRVTRSPEHRALARRIARESMVLLRNRNHLLPLARNLHLAVIGPMADARGSLLGPMQAMGRNEDVVTVLAGIREAAGAKAVIEHAEGASVGGDDSDEAGIRAAAAMARHADVAVLVLGEDRDMIGESDSRAHIDLPGRQQDLAEAVIGTGTPTVVVLISGRPLALPWLDRHAGAILDAWLPGQEGGHALADLLFGDAAPSGRLPITFPRTLGQVPIYYSYLNTGRPKDPDDDYTSEYVDEPNTPLYPFGYGLGYTDFDYGPVRLDRDTLQPGGTLTASIEVRNTGPRAGATVVQLYVHDRVASVSPPLRLLKGFRRVELKPGASRTVSFELKPSDLAFHRRDGKFAPEAGEFDVYIGGDATATRHARFRLTGSQ